MRLKKFTAIAAASVCAFGLASGVAQAVPRPIKTDSSGVVTGSYLYNQYAAMGPYSTVATVKSQPCGPVYTMYTQMLRDHHNNKMTHKCWGTFPDGMKSPKDVQFVYPRNISRMGKLPVIIYTPGIAAEPGLTDHLYHLWASHGYIVVVSYTFFNWTGYTDVQGAARLLTEAKNAASPLHGHVDQRHVVLTGHSAGGGSTESGAGWLLPTVEKQYPGLRVVAAVPMQPGPGVMVQRKYITVPVFYLTGEKDTVCTDVSIRSRYKTVTETPAWIGMVRGATHGQEMDHWRYSVFGAAVLAFSDMQVHHSQRARQFFVGPHYFLANDAAFTHVERNAKAAALR